MISIKCRWHWTQGLFLNHRIVILSIKSWFTNKQNIKSQWKHSNSTDYSSISTLRTQLIPSYNLHKVEPEKIWWQLSFSSLIINESTMRETVVGKREQYLKLKWYIELTLSNLAGQLLPLEVTRAKWFWEMNYYSETVICFMQCML